MNPRNFFAELKRRNVYKVAVAYLVVAWLLIQAASIFFPAFDAPPWVMKIFIIVIIFGFPVALIFSWAFEITPEGIKLESGIESNTSIARRTGRKIVAVTIALAVIAAGLFVYQMVGRDRWARRAGEEDGRRSAASPPNKSIAVLPFDNLSRDPDNAYFCEGVQDEIVSHLSKVGDLRVISRTSVMQYKAGAQRNLREIAQELGVANVVEGSVQRAANKVRVIAQLIDARNDVHLWAQTYDRDLADVFAIQSEIAKSIAEQLKSKLTRAEEAAIERAPTEDLVAFDYYTHAKTLLFSVSITAQEISKEFLFEAVDLLNKAVARDPAFLSAYCQLVKAHGRIYAFDIDHSPARRVLAQAAVRKAERLRADDGETHLARARFLLDFDLDFEGARKELAAAERSLSNSAEVFLLDGYIARRQGRWDESLRSLEKAIELDPRNFSLWQEIGLNYHLLRRYPEMTAAAEHAVAIVPEDGLTRAFRAVIDLCCCANPRPVHKTIHEIVTANPTVASSVADIWFDLALCEHDNAGIAQALAAISETGSQPEFVTLPRSFCEGLAARVRGDEPAARAAFMAARNELEQTVREQPQFASPLSVLGMANAAVGRKEDAIREGQRAVQLCPVTKDAVVGQSSWSFLP